MMQLETSLVLPAAAEEERRSVEQRVVDLLLVWDVASAVEVFQ